MRGGGKSVAREVEEIGDLIVNGKEPLNLSRRFEPLHDPLASPCRQMGVLRTIVQSLVLAVLNFQTHVFARRAVGFELVGDHDARRSLRLLQKLAHEAACGASISSALNQNVENESILIDRPPKPMLLAAHRDDDLVKMPFVTANWSTATNAIGVFPTEFLSPLADGFVADCNAPRCKHFFDHPQTQRKPEIEPNRVANDFRWEAMTTIERITDLFHAPKLPHNPISSVNLTVPPDLSAFSGAFVAVGVYCLNGIPNSDARPDPRRASAGSTRSGIDVARVCEGWPAGSKRSMDTRAL